MHRNPDGEKISLPWFLHPAYFLLFFLLPLNVICLYYSSDYLHIFKVATSNIDLGSAVLSIFMIVVFSISILLSASTGLEVRQRYQFPSKRVNRSLFVVGLIAVIAYGILLMPLVQHPWLIAFFLSNSAGASHFVNEQLSRIPGVTSLVGLAMPFVSLYSYARSPATNISPWRVNRVIFYLIIFEVLARAVFGSERIALIEILICYFVPRFAFYKVSGTAKIFAPIAIAGIGYSFFALGAYFRDWPYFKDTAGVSFFEFVLLDMFGYFITSLNNGAGILSHYQPFYFPAFSFSGIYLFASNILGFDGNPVYIRTHDFLRRFANTGFNSPGGLFIPFLDFGVILGTGFVACFGYLTGLIFRSFRRGLPRGMMLFPAWFIGFVDLPRNWQWGSAWFIPAAIGAVLISIYLRPPRRNSTSLIQR